MQTMNFIAMMVGYLAIGVVIGIGAFFFIAATANRRRGW